MNRVHGRCVIVNVVNVNFSVSVNSNVDGIVNINVNVNVNVKVKVKVIKVISFIGLGDLIGGLISLNQWSFQ